MTDDPIPDSRAGGLRFRHDVVATNSPQVVDLLPGTTGSSEKGKTKTASKSFGEEKTNVHHGAGPMGCPLEKSRPRCSGSEHSIPQKTLLDPFSELSLAKAIKFVIKAWNEVTPTTIANCWRKVDILPTPEQSGLVRVTGTAIRGLNKGMKLSGR